MLLKISSVDTIGMGGDKVRITLTTPVPDSLTVGYGSSINFFVGTTTTAALTPVTDSSGIPLCTFFNRPIIPYGQPITGVKEGGLSTPVPALMSIHGTMLLVKAGIKAPVTVSIFSIGGRLVRKFSTVSRSIDLRKGLGNGSYLVRAELLGKRILAKLAAFYKTESPKPEFPGSGLLSC